MRMLVLGEAPASIELYPRLRGSLAVHHAGAALRVELDAELTRGLKALGRRHGTTLFMTVLAAFAVGLIWYSKKRTVGQPMTWGEAMLGALYVFINTAMVIGLAPNTGIPLPFLSYGGSFTMINFISTGIILGVDIRRYVNR